MNKKNITLMVIAIVTLLSFVILATYAYFTGTVNVNNKANVTASTERNNMVFDTVGGAMSLNVTATNMQRSQIGLAAQNSTTLTVNFQANTSYSMVCTYDIIYEWTSNSSNRYTTHSTGVTGNEFTIKASLAGNAHVYEGTNSIKNETDLSTAVGSQASATVVSGAQIDGTGNTTSTAVWTISSKFYNVNANQSGLANKSYQGRFKVANVSCVSGSVPAAQTGPTSYWFSTSQLTFPASGGSASGHNVYIGQDSSKYYACATIQGHEVCFSQPYTQYGLEGHTLNSSFTTTQQTSVKNAILQVFNDAGINIDISSCYAYTGNAYCGVRGSVCNIYWNGLVQCIESKANESCSVNASGDAYCVIDNGPS